MHPASARGGRVAVNKPESLRATIVAAIPELAANPDRLLVFIDEGSVAATFSASLNFEWRYRLNLILTDFAAHPDAVIVPMLSWLRTHQPDLLLNQSRIGEIRFEADVLANDKIDLSITLPLTERVGVKPQDGQPGMHIEHYPEPLIEGPYPPAHWQLFLKGDLIAEWDDPRV